MSDRRWIVVGHADKGIEYTGNWTTNDGTKYDTQGNFGATYKGLHGATGVANFSYVFNGAQGRIMGTNNIKNSSGVLDPVWECFIDGVSIGVGNATIFPYIENNWQLCNWYTLTPGQHTITVNVNSRSQAFFFDRFEYLPSGQVDGAGILVNKLDPDLRYDSSWQILGTISQMTQKTGATVFFPFRRYWSLLVRHDTNRIVPPRNNSDVLGRQWIPCHVFSTRSSKSRFLYTIQSKTF